MQRLIFSLFFLLFTSFAGVSQVTVPSVVLKFDSTSISDGKFTAKVYAKSSQPNAEVFGINLRFFYDATDFGSNLVLKNFAGGYGMLGPVRVTTGNQASKTLLGFDGPARYCNSAVQLNNIEATPVLLDTARWTRLFDIELPIMQSDVSCAPLVWEKMPNWQDGGFVGGSAGLVITIVKGLGTNFQLLTTNTAPTGINYNWVFKLPVVKGKYPYGNIKCPTVAPLN